MKINELFPEVLTEDNICEFKAVLNTDNPLKWAKTLVAFANSNGGTLFVGVSDDREAFGLSLEEIDKTKNLISTVNNRHIFPHVKIKYSLGSVDEMAENFVLAVYVFPSESVVRYKDGDFSETVFVKGDGNTTPATPEQIISLAKRKYGIDGETSEVPYVEDQWKEFCSLCAEYREDSSFPSLKELQNEEIVSENGYVKTGFLMFKDNYVGDDTLICCRLWKGKSKTGFVLDSARYKGSIPQVFKNALQFIERNTKNGWMKTSSGGRKEIFSYPKEAVREALVNAIAHRDYSIYGTQIDVDIYDDRIDIVSPGSWLLPKMYNQYPLGSIPSIRRNVVLCACLDVANLMERGGTGFQTMINCYKDCALEKQPGVLIYPGFLDLRLYDILYENNSYDYSVELSDSEKVLEMLTDGPKSIKELQNVTHYKSRSGFLEMILNPLLNSNKVYRDGNTKSPTALIRINKS